MPNSLRSDEDNRAWFALRVRPNHEKRVSELINYQGLEGFLPLYRVRRRWNQRWQNVDAPLFPGYVFSRFERQSWIKIISIPGVVDAVRFGNTLASVDDEEMRALQVVHNAKAATEPSLSCWAGQSISVTAGPLAGIKGTLVEVKGVNRLLLSVTLLQRSVLVEIDRSWVTYDPLPRRAAMPQSQA